MSEQDKARAELDHPCRDTCSGWKQGYERGLQDGRADNNDNYQQYAVALNAASKEIDRLKAENEKLRKEFDYWKAECDGTLVSKYKQATAERDQLRAESGAKTWSLMDQLSKLDGVAAVNLAEPCEGDLKRVVDAYRETREERDRLRSLVKDLVEGLEYAEGQLQHAGYNGSARVVRNEITKAKAEGY